MKKGDESRKKFMIYLVAFLMLASGFFMVTRDIEQPTESSSPDIERYNVVEVGNKTALIEITGSLDEVIAIPARPDRVTVENLFYVTNTSIDGVTGAKTELSNAFLLFKFFIKNDSSIEDIKLLLNSELQDYALFRTYNGMSGDTGVYVIGSPGLQSGDYVRAILLQKVVNDIPLEIMALQQKRLFVNPGIPATVLYVDLPRFSAVLTGAIDTEKLKNRIDLTEMEYYAPSITAAMNETVIGEIRKLSGLNLTAEGNETVITGSGMERVSAVLEKYNVNYTANNGSISFTTLEGIENTTEKLVGYGITDFVVRKKALLSTPDEFVIDGRIVTMDNNVTGVIYVNTTGGQNISIDLKTIEILGQVVPVWAEEISG